LFIIQASAGSGSGQATQSNHPGNFPDSAPSFIEVAVPECLHGKNRPWSGTLKPVYEQRNPKASQYYRCVEAHFEQLEMAWDDRYARMYGF
jgi:hypothetical protein